MKYIIFCGLHKIDKSKDQKQVFIFFRANILSFMYFKILDILIQFFYFFLKIPGSKKSGRQNDAIMTDYLFRPNRRTRRATHVCANLVSSRRQWVPRPGPAQ
jgi:hypothetical protein